MIDFEIGEILGSVKETLLDEHDLGEYSEEDEENDIVIDQQSKKRKRNRIIWTFQRQFENELYVESEIKPKWYQTKVHSLSNGSKVYYKCKYPKCPAGLHLLYFSNQSKISLFTNHCKYLNYSLDNI